MNPTRTIFKYPIERPEDWVRLYLPRGAKVLNLGVQRNQLCVWAEVDKTQPPAAYDLFCVMTGGTLPTHERLKYLGTGLLDEGEYVIHVYELANE